MTIEELRRAVRSLPGVASADVMPQPGAPPIVRLWTDGTIPDAVVQRAVQLLVARGSANGSGTAPAETAAGEPIAATPTDDSLRAEDETSGARAGKRRVGLGKTLEETLPGAFAQAAPSHLATETIPDKAGVRRFLRLAIEETMDGVEVRAIDDLGREAEAAVGPGPEGLTVAVASAVARLRGKPNTRVTFWVERDGWTEIGPPSGMPMPMEMRSATVATVNRAWLTSARPVARSSNAGPVAGVVMTQSMCLNRFIPVGDPRYGARVSRCRIPF